MKLIKKIKIKNLMNIHKRVHSYIKYFIINFRIFKLLQDKVYLRFVTKFEPHFSPNLTSDGF